MREMAMRERMLALVQRREPDRVPFVMYDIMVPPDEAFEVLGPGRIGLMRWCPIWRVEHQTATLRPMCGTRENSAGSTMCFTLP